MVNFRKIFRFAKVYAKQKFRANPISDAAGQGLLDNGITDLQNKRSRSCVRRIQK